MQPGRPLNCRKKGKTSMIRQSARFIGLFLVVLAMLAVASVSAPPAGVAERLATSADAPAVDTASGMEEVQQQPPGQRQGHSDAQQADATPSGSEPLDSRPAGTIVASREAEHSAGEPAGSGQPDTQGSSEPAAEPSVEKLKGDGLAEEEITIERLVDEGVLPAPESWASIALEEPILFSPPGFSFFGHNTQKTLRDWLVRLAKARKDDSIDGVLLTVGLADLSWSQATELADAIRRLDAVKPVHMHLTSASTPQYILAAAGRSVTIEPAGRLMLLGVSAELAFYRDTMDWVGLKPQFVQIGQYKGASEPLTRNEPSEELRAEYNKILDGHFDRMCRQIADARDLDVPTVRTILDKGPLTAKEARTLELVDAVLPRQQWVEWLEEEVVDKPIARVDDYGLETPDMPDFENPFALLGMLLKGPKGPSVPRNSIAIVYIEGMIVPGESGESLFGQRYVGTDTIGQCLTEATEEENVHAVILRIQSPGGSALASELIFQHVRRCGESKPVIASVSGLCASGGYYIAAAADEIYADPVALVGSIGVVGGKLATDELMTKLHIQTYQMKRGKFAGLNSLRAWNAEEMAVIRDDAQQWYDLFVRRVREGRGERIEQYDDATQGRIFTAGGARAIGLIDAIGGLNEAAQAAKKAAGLTRARYLVLPRPTTLADIFTGGASASTRPAVTGVLHAQRAGLLGHLGGRRFQAVRYLLGFTELLDTETFLAADPHFVRIHP